MNAQAAFKDAQQLYSFEQIREMFKKDTVLSAISDDGKNFDAIYCPEYDTIFFAIPRSINIIGYAVK